jgi:hypothetical protein
MKPSDAFARLVSQLFKLQAHYIKSRLTNSACNVFPSIAGLRSTITPAASNAEILESAPPFPPLTIAPIFTLVNQWMPQLQINIPA